MEDGGTRTNLSILYFDDLVCNETNSPFFVDGEFSRFERRSLFCCRRLSAETMSFRCTECEAVCALFTE